MKTMIVLDNLTFHEKHYDILTEVNRVCESTTEDVCLSVMNVSSKVVETKCAVMNVSEISSFSDGVLLATTLKDADAILSTVNNSIKVLYLWDIDWMFSRLFNEDIRRILNNERLVVISRSKSHRDILKAVCDKDIKIIEDFNLETIWNLLEKTKT